MQDKYRIEEDMWSESRSQYGGSESRSHYGEIQRGRLQSGRPRSADFHRTVQIMQRRPDYDRGGGAISRDYSCYAHSEDYRGYSEVREFGHGRVFGPPLKTGSWGDENSRWPRDEYSGSRQADYRYNSRRNTYYSSQFARERSPHKREVSFYREESPHNRSGSSTSSRSYSPEKGKQPPSYQSQFSRMRSPSEELRSPGSLHDPDPHTAASPVAGTQGRRHRKRCERKQKRGKRAGVRLKLKIAARGLAVPSVPLSNEHSLENKQQLTQSETMNCSTHSRTETCLQNNIPDTAIQLEGLANFRADRNTATSDKERSVCALIPSRDASPSISIPPTSSKSANFEKGSKTSDNLNEEIVNEWSSEQQQIPELEITEHNKGDAVQMLLPENLDDPEMSTPGPIDNIDLGQTDHRTRTIAEKAKEIEEVYRQDCETFGMVVQMLINKDPSLENTVQFALRENLREIEDRCTEELKRFITQYDSAPGDNTANL
ncbi:periphilin-1 isoform X1 [Mobula hypostoma]|uniref:periphilin-1 isoform X1 n=1 Tax=Mobula hypostoma TaxID=723540 RepID=UPI002FC39594